MYQNGEMGVDYSEFDTVPSGKPILSDEFVNEIVSCRKLIPKRIHDVLDKSLMKPSYGSFRNSIQLDAGEYNLVMSIRQLVDDCFDFSVVLTYADLKGNKYIIRRYNGNHGMHRNFNTGEEITGPHIHMISEISQRVALKDESIAVATDRYVNLRDAVQAFMEDLNISYEWVKGVERIERFRGS